MRNALLVAIPEYVENARTKGFWFGIFMLPVILALSIQVPIFLERKGAPVRHFVLQDFSGDFERAIEAEIERQHQQTVLRQLNEYARKFARAQPGVTASELPWVRFSDLSPAGVDRFTGAGGTQLYLEELKGYLPPDAPRFEEPRKLYRRIEIPGLKLENLSAASEQLRVYLWGEEMVPADGKEVLLNAAILVPAEVRLLRPAEAEGEGGRGGGGAGGVQYWSGNLTDKSLRNNKPDCRTKDWVYTDKVDHTAKCRAGRVGVKA